MSGNETRTTPWLHKSINKFWAVKLKFKFKWAHLLIILMLVRATLHHMTPNVLQMLSLQFDLQICHVWKWKVVVVVVVVWRCENGPPAPASTFGRFGFQVSYQKSLVASNQKGSVDSLCQ